MLSEHFYTSPKRTDRSTDSTSMLIKSPYTNSQIYSSRNIFPNDLPVYALGLTDRSQPIRSSASSADPANVELVSQQRCNNTMARQLAQWQEEKRQQEEQILELEEYVHIQDDYFSNQMAEAELKTTVTEEAHEEDK